MTPEEVEQLARLLVKWHNQITSATASIYGSKIDKSLAQDTFTTLFVKGDFGKLKEIQKGFTENE